MTTTDGDEITVMIFEAGTDETQEAGTATGEVQVFGTVTVAGTYANEDTAIVTTAEDGTEATTLDGADDGTSWDWIITAEVDVATVIYLEEPRVLGTQIAGTTTGEVHVDGTTTVAGTLTHE